jgi:hypothetical protein
MTIHLRSTAACLAAVAALLVAAPGHAQSPTDSAMAEGLFQAGRGLAADGKFAEACPKFAESMRLDPKLGTLMNLALCHEKEGKIATAWAEYKRAAELAGRAGQAERQQVAKDSVARLDAMLPGVLLHLETPGDTTVTLDGQPIGAAVLDTPLPIDPGAHQVGASAPARKPWSTTITVAPVRGVQTVAIPALEVDVVAPPPPPPSGSMRPLGYGLIIGGGVAIVTGAVFGIVAFAEKGAAASQCTAAGVCNSQGQSDVSLKKTSEAISTVGFIAGIAAAGAGVFFVVRSGHHDQAGAATAGSIGLHPLIGSGTGGALLSGDF